MSDLRIIQKEYCFRFTSYFIKSFDRPARIDKIV